MNQPTLTSHVSTDKNTFIGADIVEAPNIPGNEPISEPVKA